MGGIKKQLMSLLRSRMEAELQTLLTSAKVAGDAATHEESRPENKYDTRGLEASYLAGAQAARAEELKSMLARLATISLRTFDEDDAIAVTALVEVELKGNAQSYFIVPFGGGYTLSCEGRSVQTISPQSPLGTLLLGKFVGESVVLKASPEVREFEVVTVE